jgi:hypothetical protein
MTPPTCLQQQCSFSVSCCPGAICLNGTCQLDPGTCVGDGCSGGESCPVGACPVYSPYGGNPIACCQHGCLDAPEPVENPRDGVRRCKCAGEAGATQDDGNSNTGNYCPGKGGCCGPNEYCCGSNCCATGCHPDGSSNCAPASWSTCCDEGDTNCETFRERAGLQPEVCTSTPDLD